MNLKDYPLPLALSLFLAAAYAGATEFYVSPSGTGIPPYSDWTTAATNIQDAVDAASDGDLVWVTNGVYASGGKVMAGDLTNRVALDKALTVQSVNGPRFTFIEGMYDPAINGPLAVRCAWLTNGAILRGFALQRGATRSAGDGIALQSGGGVWCTSNSLVANCILTGNAANSYGGGAFRGTLVSCLISSNKATGNGSACYQSKVSNSLITRNISSGNSGNVYEAVLTSSTVANNTWAGTYRCNQTNCIVRFNYSTAPTPGEVNFTGGYFWYSCTTPSPLGGLNITSDPLLLADGVHLAETSPCRGKGTNVTSGLDIDGQPWANPPSMGCDEWSPAPAVTVAPVAQYRSPPPAMTLTITSAGQPPFTCWWTHEGLAIEDDGHYSSARSTSLLVNNVGPADAGRYQVVLSNAFGVATSLVAQVSVHCVDAAGVNPMAPYTSWATAATNIQDAIDAASTGGLVLVTNGVYTSGGRTMGGAPTNRVVLDKALGVVSVSGPTSTVIDGAAANGFPAGRCAWLTNDATLAGFTLRNGNAGSQYAGGVWCASSNSVVANCIIRSNVAQYAAGAYRGALFNCAILGNTAGSFGGGSMNSILNNCTVLTNSAAGTGGAYYCTLTNCLLYGNQSGTSDGNHFGGSLTYCCTTPLPAGAGNINANPLLLPDGIHLGSGSSCIAAGTNLITGRDIDGQAWGAPPSIGCDEWQPTPQLVLPPQLRLTSDPVGFTISAIAAGQPPFTCWWLKNGVPLEDDARFSSAHGTSLIVGIRGITGPETYQVIVSNTFGAATSTVVEIVPHCVDAGSPNPVSPYLSWATAATNIQDAIDTAAAGDIVLVTNGIYASGGRVMGGDLLNRVAVNKPVIVASLHGPATTIIQGAWDPGSTNGPLSIRCAWVTNGAAVSGFTLRGGSTRAWTTSPTAEQYGGGVFSPTNGTVADCVITDCCAGAGGGGAMQAALLSCALFGNASRDGGGACKSILRGCALTRNSATSNGGAANSSALQNCALTANTALIYGGGAYGGNLLNCTASGNSAGSSASGAGGGVSSANLTNCIVYGNYSLYGSTSVTSNYYSSSLSFCCAVPLPSGEGNIAADPSLLADRVHLATNSPCHQAGSNLFVTGTDIDGQPWANPPSMGCDEWWPAPVLSQPQQSLGIPNRLQVVLGSAVGGQPPFTFAWLKDGMVLSDGSRYSNSTTAALVLTSFGPEDAGTYQLAASNNFGVVTSAVATVVVHCVDAAAGQSAAPYSTWASAASVIQDAIDAADAGDIVLVTNGVYSSGGRVLAGDLTNRIALYKALTVASVGGPEVTTISGQRDPWTTNGPLAVRAVWLGDGALLQGFTIRDGATRTNDDMWTLMSGGGVWSSSTNAIVRNCQLLSNAASFYGGGSYRAFLDRCVLRGNSAGNTGGGAYEGMVMNSLIRSNSAVAGGGVGFSAIRNCTVMYNLGIQEGGGMYAGSARNCIVCWNNCRISSPWENFSSSGADVNYTAYAGYWVRAIGGVGNTNLSPVLLDEYHQFSDSPTRGLGSVLYASGTDLDGKPWANPPSMGCDEFYEEACRGPLTLSLKASYWPSVTQEKYEAVVASLTGRPSRVEWSFGDGSFLTNRSSLATTHIWKVPGDYVVTVTAYNLDNPGGVSTNLTIHVVPLEPPLLSFSLSSATDFTVRFQGQPGVFYVVERTTNLTPPVTWQTVLMDYNYGTPVVFTDFQATNGVSFYRVRTQ